MTSKKERRRTLDIRLAIQAGIMLIGVSTVYYNSETTAAVLENKVDTHNENIMLHPVYEKLTHEFVPRMEVQIHLDNIDVHLANIDGEMEKIETAVQFIKDNMHYKPE